MWLFNRKKTEQRSMTVDELISYLGLPNTNSGEYVSPNSAEALPAVMNAVTVISEAVASMPCYLYKLNKKGERERISDHPVEYLLNEMPNRKQTPYQFKRTMMRHCLLGGNAYAVIHWGKDGRPQGLESFPPYAVTPKRLGNGKYAYSIVDEDGNVTNYLQDEILHLRYASDDGFLGRSPVTICREAIGLGLAQQRHGSSIMKNGLMASGYVSMAEWMDDAKGKKALNALERYKGAKNAGKTPILEGGMKYEQLGMSNQDAEWLQSRRFTIEDIARIFNISPMFLQEYSHSSYSNFSEATRSFLTLTLRPWLTNFEQQLKDALMIDINNDKSRYLIEFDTSDLMRTSPIDRFNSYNIAIKSGVMNPNEARLREGLLPYEGGEEFSQAWKQTVEVKKEPKNE